MIAKLPVFLRKEAQEIRIQLYYSSNIPVKFLDNKELVIVVKNGYILSKANRQVDLEDRGTFIKEVRRLYKADNKVKV